MAFNSQEIIQDVRAEFEHLLDLGAFHLSYKVVRPPKVTGYAWGDRFRQAIGEQAEN